MTIARWKVCKSGISSVREWDVSRRLKAGQGNGGPAVCLPAKNGVAEAARQYGIQRNHGQLDNFSLTALNTDGGLGQLASGM